MPLEKGGRADKQGNSYEINCVIYELLKVLDEVNYSVVIEALGEDEEGTDILVTDMSGHREHQQCKSRNASKESWNMSDLKARGILEAWRKQLNRDNERRVALVSPLACTFLYDMHKRAANTSGSAEDFYKIQIAKSSTEFNKFYKSFCEEMGLRIEQKNTEADRKKTDERQDNRNEGNINQKNVLKSIEYLKRISYKQMSEYQLNEFISMNIRYRFSSDENKVYNALVSYVVMGDILGQELTQQKITDYLNEQGMIFSLRDGDKRIAPRIKELNEEYKGKFIPLKSGFVHREEADECIQTIEADKHIIISGSAGCGKSGCAEAVLKYCEQKGIVHIAIKLDVRIPNRSCEKWGQELGFQNSIVAAIHNISQNEKAVIILDQLDALRWTQANSAEAVTVCMELIRQVKFFNEIRDKKITIVFVCRSYDLENDNNIKGLFRKQNNSGAEASQDDEWKVIKVDCFKEDTVKKVVGSEYNKMSARLKNLLKIPSNLYIWQHLDKESSYDGCLTTSHLIDKWFEQICMKSRLCGIAEQSVSESKTDIVNRLDKMGRLYVPKQILKIDVATLDYLISSELIVVQGNKVGFVHQSILDYFISQNMLEKYYDGASIDEIIGEKSRQTPTKRYQVQMFLQNILELDSAEFIDAGGNMLASDNIRYYIKYLFYEILGQINNPDDNITTFIIDNCDSEEYGSYLIRNTIYGRKDYVNILLTNEIMERWYNISDKKEIVFNLLISMSPDLTEEAVEFIRKHAFVSKEDDAMFMRCFHYDITQESEAVFELRMMFYKHYPQFAKDVYIDIKKMMDGFEKRTVRLIAFWLKRKINSKGKSVYHYEEDLISSDSEYIIKNADYILDELLGCLSKEKGRYIKYGNWSYNHAYMGNIERVSVELVKKAAVALADNSPDTFWQYFEPYMGMGYAVYNEIILTGLAHLPVRYSDRIIDYITENFNDNIFDYTSGADNELEFIKKVLLKHTSECSDETFARLENIIYYYVSPDALQMYKNRIEYNQDKEIRPVYWSYWGDLQYELLPCLPEERISKKSRELIKILCRRFDTVKTCYVNDNGHSGWVKSPVAGKKISAKQWIRIITNEKLKKRQHSKWISVKGGFIESSYDTFIQDFELEVKQNPVEMIELVLSHKEDIPQAFVDALFIGVNMSEQLSEVDSRIIERMLLECPCDMESQRASYFCGIIETLSSVRWSEEVLCELKNIAVNHHNPDNDKPCVTSQDDKEMKSCHMLQSNALNCVRGRAVRTIGKLLEDNKSLYEEFADIIDKAVRDDNAAVRYAALYALCPAYNIDRQWAEERILYILERDVRTLSFSGSKNVLFYLYPKYKERVIDIISKAYESDDKKLTDTASYMVCEFYIRYDEFTDIMSTPTDKNEEQVKAILDMAIMYLEVDKYREAAKKIILDYRNTDINVEFPLSKMFYDKYINEKRDRQFLQEFIKTNLSRRIVDSFMHFLTESAVSVVDYSDIIIELCENVLSMDSDELQKQWGLTTSISELIITLYDETSNSNITSQKKTAQKCMDLWDVMFERQIGAVRRISEAMMER